MIAVHHLNESRPQRILCLLEELREIHPYGKSPVITEGDRIIAESEAIIDYILCKHGEACATCLDLRMPVRTVAALFPAAIETIRAGYWKI